MQPSASSGFQETGDGIQFWFLDRESVVNFVGIVTSLEHLGNSEFRLQTVKGPSLTVPLRPEQVAEYRRLGGFVRPIPESGPAARPRSPSGFQKAPSGVFFWVRDKHRVKYLGPVTALRHDRDDRYFLMVKDTRHAICLSPEEIDEFQRLNGALAEQGEPASMGSVAIFARASHNGPLVQASTLLAPPSKVASSP